MDTKVSESKDSEKELVKVKDSVKDVKLWHSQQEKILKQWGETCSSYRWLHYYSFKKYKRCNIGFTLPVIILSTLTGTANFAQSSFSDSYKSYGPLFIGGLNIIAGVITTVATFLRVSELSENHRVSYIAFGKLARNIKLELSIPLTARRASGSEFIKLCKNDMDRLMEQGSSIPRELLTKFEYKFRKVPMYKPEIITLAPIDIFREINRSVDKDGYYSTEFIEKDLELDRPLSNIDENTQHDNNGIIDIIKDSFT